MPRYAQAATLLAALVVILLDRFATSLYGAGVSPDSIAYFAAARSLSAGHGVPADFTAWPPLYPILLAVESWLARTTDLIDVATIHGALVHGLLIVTAAFALRLQSQLHWLMRVIAILVIAACEPLLWISTSAWSEGTFLLFALWSLLTIELALRRRSMTWIAVAGICAALAFLTRYVGFTVVAAGGIALLVDSRMPFRARLRAAIVFGVIATTPPALWLLRNWSISGAPAGARVLISGSLLVSLRDAVAASLSWLPLQIGLIAAVIVIVVQLTARERPDVASSIPALAIFSITYLLAVAILASRVKFDALDKRLMSPVAVALFLYITHWLAPTVAWARRRPVAATGAWMLGALLLFTAARQVIAEAEQLHSDGAGGLNVRYWHEHPLIASLRASPPDRPVESNAPEALQVLAGLDAHFTPRRDGSAERLRGTWPAQPILVAWFWQLGGRSYLYDLNELAAVADTELVHNFDDATLIRAAPSP